MTLANDKPPLRSDRPPEAASPSSSGTCYFRLIMRLQIYLHNHKQKQRAKLFRFWLTNCTGCPPTHSLYHFTLDHHRILGCNVWGPNSVPSIMPDFITICLTGLSSKLPPKTKMITWNDFTLSEKFQRWSWQLHTMFNLLQISYDVRELNHGSHTHGYVSPLHNCTRGQQNCNNTATVFPLASKQADGKWKFYRGWSSIMMKPQVSKPSWIHTEKLKSRVSQEKGCISYS